MSNLDQIFDSVGDRSLFKNKQILQSNHTPEDIPHREKQIDHIASILAPCLLGQKTSNLFIYGKTGTGKTICVQHVSNELTKRSTENKILTIQYINCKLKKVADTEYRILAALIKQLGGNVPATGLPTDKVYNIFLELLANRKEKLLIIILDEIDQAVKKISSDFLYSLIRLNSELNNLQITIIGISNDAKFLEMIDPRVRSSLSEEELIFPPYDALQLQDILKKRANQSFKPNVVTDGVISKCAAFAAREHGDARRALDLLRVAGEIAEREASAKIEIKHIDMANEKIERDKILDIIETGTKQFQLVLYSIFELSENNHKHIFTGEIYNTYQDLCKKINIDILTQRRVSDILAELDMFGLINARVISKGRQGRMREIKLDLPDIVRNKAKDMLAKSIDL